MELQYLRQLVGAAQTGATKLSAYAQQCEDAELKSTLEREAQACRQKADRLLTFLH